MKIFKMKLLVVLFTFFSLAMAQRVYAADTQAVPVQMTVFVDANGGYNTAYSVEGQSYLRLRDLAYRLNGTDKQFKISWNEKESAVSLQWGEYTPIGNEGEEAAVRGLRPSVPVTAGIIVNGAKTMLPGYEVDGSRYVRIQDLAKALDFHIDGGGYELKIDTKKKYNANLAEAINLSPPTPIKSLPISQSLKKGMTDKEFQEAYDIAYGIVLPIAGRDRLSQAMQVFYNLSWIRHGSDPIEALMNGHWSYSMSSKHYADVYGFFVLNETSCAGDVRAAALCYSILGIPNEHVNENQYDHQWLRVEVDQGEYLVVDVNAGFMDWEYVPYKHPMIP